MLDLFAYDFIVRGFVAGVVIALVAPVVGIFLVLKRYSLIADTLSHVSLAGIAVGLLLNIHPLFTAIGATILSSIAIEKLRISKKIYGESTLALFLSGSLALAVVLLGISHGFNTSLFNYLFGSIVTVTQTDIVTVLLLGTSVMVIISGLYKEFVYITFDEESAKVSGIPTKLLNTLLIVLAAITISLSIPIIGILLISSLLVLPVITALQCKKNFLTTIVIAQIIAVFSVILGIIIAFYGNLPPGGTIVLVTLGVFFLVQLTNK